MQPHTHIYTHIWIYNTCFCACVCEGVCAVYSYVNLSLSVCVCVCAPTCLRVLERTSMDLFKNDLACCVFDLLPLNRNKISLPHTLRLPRRSSLPNCVCVCAYLPVSITGDLSRAPLRRPIKIRNLDLSISHSPSVPLSPYSLSTYIYIYIYIYMCVCECVCVWLDKYQNS